MTERCTHEIMLPDQHGALHAIAHDRPVALRHLYAPPPLGETAIELYTGVFTLGTEEWNGSVRLDLTARPRGLASGARAAEAGDIERLLSDAGANWAAEPAFNIVGDPWTTPSAVASPSPSPMNRSMTDEPIGRGFVGVTGPADRVTFLLPNGFDAIDGDTVCVDGQSVNASVVAAGAGWSLRLDRRIDVPRHDLVSHLNRTEQHTITHIGELRRTNGDTFTAADTEDVLDVVGVALSLATGCGTHPILPVGWVGDEPQWAMWGVTRFIDRPRTVMGWIDVAVGSEQIAELLTASLRVAGAPARWLALRQAVNHLLNSSGPDVLATVTLPVAALSSASYIYLTQVLPEGSAHRCSVGSWNKLGMTGSIEALCTALGMDATIPARLSHMVAVQQDMLARQRQLPAPTAVAVLVTLRNHAMHPKPSTVGRYTTRQWAETGFFARDALQLAALALAGYTGPYLPVTAMHRHAGASIPVPWAAPNAVATP